MLLSDSRLSSLWQAASNRGAEFQERKDVANSALGRLLARATNTAQPRSWITQTLRENAKMWRGLLLFLLGFHGVLCGICGPLVALQYQ